MKAHILIVDDDPLHTRLLSFLLTDAGYDATIVGDPRTVGDAFRRSAVDLALVGVRLPYIDGFSLCAQLKRQHGDTPIILLNERRATDDLVKGFDQGADDYLTRPYQPALLLARVQAVLRRYRRAERNLFGTTLRVGGTSLDLDRLSFTGASGHSVAVTPTEMRILECLMRNAHIVISREQVIVDTWGYDSESADNRVDVYVRRLRRKIEARPADRDVIRTIRGVGYVYEGAAGGQRDSA